MHIETLNDRIIRATLSPSDLEVMGIKTQELPSNPHYVDIMLNAILDELYDSYGFSLEGPVSVQLALTPKNTVVVVLISEYFITDFDEVEQGAEPYDEGVSNQSYNNFYDAFDEVFSEGKPDLEDNPGETVILMYKFRDIEDTIKLAHNLVHLNVGKSSLHHYEHYYYLTLPEVSKENDNHLNIEAVISEYGQPVKRSIHYLNEYAKAVVTEKAVEELVTNFKL